MARPLTQDQLDAIWREIDAGPTRPSHEIAAAVGLAAPTVRHVRQHNRRIAKPAYTFAGALHVAPKIKPKHVRSEIGSAEWWAENDLGSRRLMQRMARERQQQMREAAE